MPYCVTMPRAMSVQRSMSSDAPVVISPNTSSSAVRPPSSIAIESSSSVRVRRYLSSVGRASVQPERPAAGDDRHLVDRVGALEHVADQRVAGLVVGDRELLLLAHHPALALRARPCTRSMAASSSAWPISCRLRRAASSAASFMRLARSAPVKPGRAPGEHVEADVRLERLALGVHLEDRLAALEVGAVDDDLAVEAARAQQGGVEDVGPVGGGDEDHAGAGVEAVHLDEHLVERLLPLVVPAAEAGAAVAADGVDLVDEDDRRGRRLGLLEQVAHAAGADADEHLDEVGAGDREERHAGLAGHGPGQQRLAGAGRAVEQHALRDLGADGLEAGRVLEELLDLLELLDRLVAAGDVGEGDLGLVLGHLPGLGLAELHHPAAAALHRVDEEQEQRRRAMHHRQEAEQQRRPDGVLLLVDRRGRWSGLASPSSSVSSSASSCG